MNNCTKIGDVYRVSKADWTLKYFYSSLEEAKNTQNSNSNFIKNDDIIMILDTIDIYFFKILKNDIVGWITLHTPNYAGFNLVKIG